MRAGDGVKDVETVRKIQNYYWDVYTQRRELAEMTGYWRHGQLKNPPSGALEYYDEVCGALSKLLLALKALMIEEKINVPVVKPFVKLDVEERT